MLVYQWVLGLLAMLMLDRPDLQWVLLLLELPMQV